MFELLAALAVLTFGGNHPRQPIDPFTFGNPSFCGEAPLVRDFGLSRFPRVQELPRSGDLPFGPRTVSLAGPLLDPILRLGESYGYRLGSQNYYGRTPLHWTLSARLVSVDRRGRPRGEVDRKTIHVRTISAGETWRLYLKPPRHLGFYRYDLRITDRSGVELAHYGKYVRVIPSFWRVRLGLDKRRVKPGQRVLNRVENLGSGRPFYGEEFRVQRQVNGQWVRPPKLPRGMWVLWLGTAGPGEAGGCSQLRLPAYFPDGRYRIIKWVERSAGRPVSRHRVRLVAPFEVVGHASVRRRAQALMHRLIPRLNNHRDPTN